MHSNGKRPGKEVTIIIRCAWCNPKRELSRRQVWMDDPNSPDPTYSDTMCESCARKFEEDMRRK